MITWRSSSTRMMNCLRQIGHGSITPGDIGGIGSTAAGTGAMTGCSSSFWSIIGSGSVVWFTASSVRVANECVGETPGEWLTKLGVGNGSSLFGPMIPLIRSRRVLVATAVGAGAGVGFEASPVSSFGGSTASGVGGSATRECRRTGSNPSGAKDSVSSVPAWEIKLKISLICCCWVWTISWSFIASPSISVQCSFWSAVPRKRQANEKFVQSSPIVSYSFGSPWIEPDWSGWSG